MAHKKLFMYYNSAYSEWLYSKYYQEELTIELTTKQITNLILHSVKRKQFSVHLNLQKTQYNKYVECTQKVDVLCWYSTNEGDRCSAAGCDQRSWYVEDGADNNITTGSQNFRAGLR